MEDGGGGHWLNRMEWRPAGWSMYLPLLIFPCTIKSRSSLLAPAHLGGLGKRAVKRLWWWCGISYITFLYILRWYRDGRGCGELWRLLLNADVLVAIIQGMWAVKLLSATTFFSS